MKRIPSVRDCLLEAMASPVTWSAVEDEFINNVRDHKMLIGYDYNPFTSKQEIEEQNKAIRKEFQDFVNYIMAFEEKAPCPGIIVASMRVFDEVEQLYGTALLFNAEDIISLKQIPSWDPLTANYDLDDRHSVFWLGDEDVACYLHDYSILPDPIPFNREDLPRIMNAKLPVGCDVFSIAAFIYICSRLVKDEYADHVTRRPEEVYVDGEIPWEKDDDYSDPFEVDCRRVVRKAVLATYVALYHSLLNTKRKLIASILD